MIPNSKPLLGLRMRSGRKAPPREYVGCDLVERVNVMLNQDDSSAYRCRDYIGRRTGREAAKLEEASPSFDDECPTLVNEDTVDAVCREKMCEWSYRVCDHFHTGREAVAISFSYLDRFLDRCSCDRTAFKLAAMTTLYMASKIFNNTSRRITISSLAELSRGEFEKSHISEMEMIILKTLDWRLHPPTAHDLLNSFFALLPFPSSGQISASIYQRAVFFAELSLYDYSFVSKDRALIAIVALINSMEGMDDQALDQHHCMFVKAIEEKFGVRYQPEEVEACRNRLWYVYSMSAQYKEDDYLVSPQSPKESIKNVMAGDGSVVHSPVCVAEQ